MPERDHLLHHQGQVVPWVTRWTGERRDDPIGFRRTRDGSLSVDYAGGPVDRDATGILWQREGIVRSGEPEWRTVSTYRQRSSMRRAQCEVCGRVIDTRPIPWLMPLALLQTDHDPAGGLTTSTPTCAECVPIALELCPFLQRTDYAIAQVTHYRVWGVYGEAVTTAMDGAIHRINHIMYGYRDGVAGLTPSAVLAKQLVVVLTDYTLEKI